MKSLLSSFKNDFNRKITIEHVDRMKNSIGEISEQYVPSGYIDIPCLLLLVTNKTKQWLNDRQTEYLTATHAVRMDFGPEVNVGDRITDNTGEVYFVLAVNRSPGFGGSDDHLYLLCEKKW